MVHLYFTDEKLNEERDKLDKSVEIYRNHKTAKTASQMRIAREVYKRKFEQFNLRARKKLKLPLTGLIVWQKGEKPDVDRS